MSHVIRSRGGRRPVGAKGIDSRVGESIFDRDVINLYRGSDTLERESVTPAQAGVQSPEPVDSGLRRNDG